jgi:two-component system cell cycle response regulator
MSDPGQGFQVLVVDDSVVSRKLVENTLSDGPYTLLFAKDGREALELFAQHLPHLVITDWMMPDISGVELCRKIREEYQGSYTYIILLTSVTEKKSVVQGLSAGADDYLTKPFHSDELLARIGVGRRITQLNREIAAKNMLLEEIAHTDPLTGLPNRRAIEMWADRQLKGAERHGYPMWVVLADLDAFKPVNDTYGHEAGDRVLRRFAEVLRANTRSADICGRMGGDEFIHVVSHAEKGNVERVVGRLREQIAAQKFVFGGKSVSVTASFGAAVCQGNPAPEFSALVAAADEALYAAKRAGGNQVKLVTLDCS